MRLLPAWRRNPSLQETRTRENIANRAGASEMFIDNTEQFTSDMNASRIAAGAALAEIDFDALEFPPSPTASPVLGHLFRDPSPEL